VDAVRLLGEAVARFAERGMVLWEIHARLLLAGRLAGLGRLEEAAGQAGLAKSAAVEVGSPWLRGLAVDRQRAIGARRPRPSGRPADAPGGQLSAREAEIAAMVRAGRSNRDIAATLFVSVKTVEAHLTRIYRKTGAKSRTALAAAASLPPAVGAG
jgi:DNA-binding CsgD family transcriptional regulator